MGAFDYTTNGVTMLTLAWLPGELWSMVQTGDMGGPADMS